MILNTLKILKILKKCGTKILRKAMKKFFLILIIFLNQMNSTILNNKVIHQPKEKTLKLKLKFNF